MMVWRFRLIAGSRFTGISDGAKRGLPMLTRAAFISEPLYRGTTVRTPAIVSMVTSPTDRGTMPRSMAYLAKHRMPLPHISPSEPSALNIRILRSATSESITSIRPSLPTPKWRSLIAWDSWAQSCSGIARASTYT